VCAVVVNKTAYAEEVTVLLIKGDTEVGRQVISLPGRASGRVDFSCVFAAADRPSVMVAIEAILPSPPGDSYPADNTASATVVVR
jgi:hypothetical protein